MMTSWWASAVADSAAGGVEDLGMDGAVDVIAELQKNVGCQRQQLKS
jgi:hypothetical protein